MNGDVTHVLLFVSILCSPAATITSIQPQEEFTVNTNLSAAGIGTAEQRNLFVQESREVTKRTPDQLVRTGSGHGFFSLPLVVFTQDVLR